VIASRLGDQLCVGRASARCGAVTLIQRYGSALNLNLHFHVLWLEGCTEERNELPRAQFRSAG
jgi:hypothetical protein